VYTTQHYALLASNVQNVNAKPKPGFFKWGPQASLGATEWFSEGHEQRSLLGSFAVTLHNPSVTIY